MIPLTPVLASHFAQTALAHVAREWPNKLDHVLGGPADLRSPRSLHPVFFGSYDWHSCVHGHWLLARLFRRFPQLPEADAIQARFGEQFVREKIAGEIAYLARPESRGFERPYGWAWALMLAAEIARHQTPEGGRWSEALAPLADAFKERFEAWLLLATYPVRAGTHANTAFALVLALDYAAAFGEESFATLCREKALAWYDADQGCQAWEPSGDDFLSPALIEAACMGAVLQPDGFRRWFAAFLPGLARGEPHNLFVPAQVSDRTDGKIAHLDGLNLSRAWCWRLVSGAAGDEKVRRMIEQTTRAHIESALPHIAGDYMGAHWLASFALLALDPDSG